MVMPKQPPTLIGAERLSRKERRRRFRASVITDVGSESARVKHLVERASDRYLQQFCAD